MRIAKKGRSGNDTTLEVPNDRELGAALVQALDVPLNAIRISMEALMGELGEKATGHRLPLVLDKVGRLERNVRDLIAFASPSEPQPLRCTLDEITQSACDGLPQAFQGRILRARHACGEAVHADGPMISCCLRRLMENAVEAGSPEVLLISRLTARGAEFTVVDAAPADLEIEWAAKAFHSNRPDRMGLGLPLVLRDISLMGGELRMHATPRGSTCIELHVPGEAVSTPGKEIAA